MLVTYKKYEPMKSYLANQAQNEKTVFESVIIKTLIISFALNISEVRILKEN